MVVKGRSVNFCDAKLKVKGIISDFERSELIAAGLLPNILQLKNILLQDLVIKH